MWINRRNFTNFERNLAMMVIYLPVKFEFDWSNCFRVRVRKQKCGQTDGWIDKGTINGQTNTQNFTNFERNLAMMVIYLPVKFEFDWSNRFGVRVRKRKCGQTDGQTNGRKTDKRTDRISPISMSLSSLNSIGQTVFELESGNEKCGQTDGHRTHQSNRRVGYTQPA